MLQRARRRLARWRGGSLRRVLRSGCPLRSLALRTRPAPLGPDALPVRRAPLGPDVLPVQRALLEPDARRALLLLVLVASVLARWYLMALSPLPEPKSRQSQEFCHDGNILNPVDQKNLFVQLQKYGHLLEARVDTDQQCLTPDIYFIVMSRIAMNSTFKQVFASSNARNN